MIKNGISYFLKQLIQLVLLLITVSILSFTLVHFSPIDPVQQYIRSLPNISMEQREAIAQYWGLDRHPIAQFLSWGKALLHGDFGISLLYRQPVITIIREKFANSFALMGVSFLLSGLIGFSLGCLMGVWHDKIGDRILRRICLIMCSVPTFWFGLMMLLLFSVILGWFPVGFSTPIGMLSEKVTFGERMYHLILPVLTLSFASFSNIALHTRQKLIDVLESDYVLFARARGESTSSIVKRHGLRNILLPAITLQFASFSELFGGSVLAETIFSYPGLGSAASIAGLNSDLPLLLGITLFSSFFVFLGNFIANLLYEVIDPNIREGYQCEP